MSVADRLNEFVKAKYGDKHGYKSMFAKDIGVSAGQALQYLTGERNPGNKIQQKLRDIGCDIEWLMTGREIVTIANKKVVIYPRDNEEEPEGTPATMESDAIIEKMSIQISQLMKYNEELKSDLIQKNEELMDKKKIIALLEDKILSMGTSLGNESSNIQFPVQLLQKIK